MPEQSVLIPQPEANALPLVWLLVAIHVAMTSGF
jgi:hypothetical protein